MTAAKMPLKNHDPSLVFANMLQGPAIRVVVGTSGPPSTHQTYILPQALLRAHSGYFNNELAKLNSAHNTPAPENDKEAQVPKADAEETHFTPDASRTSSPPVAPAADTQTLSTIHLEDVDAVAFGLFLTFLYHGSYRPSYPPPPSTSPSPVPPPILAWTLGTYLRAPAFTNHSMAHIYANTSVHFALTPHIVEYIWTHTGAGQPLRAFVLDVLCSFWTRESPHIARGWQAGWEALFDREEELRRVFIFGLQGRRVGVLGAYCVAEGPGPHASAVAAQQQKVGTSEEKTVLKDGKMATATATAVQMQTAPPGLVAPSLTKKIDDANTKRTPPAATKPLPSSFKLASPRTKASAILNCLKHGIDSSGPGAAAKKVRFSPCVGDNVEKDKAGKEGKGAKPNTTSTTTVKKEVIDMS